MKKLLILCVFLAFVFPIQAQKQQYNCVILDSLINVIRIKKSQNDFLLPLFKSGEIKKDGDLIRKITQNEKQIREIDSVLSIVKIKEGTLFLNDTLFSLDNFNIIVDTFHFFDNSCKACADKSKRYTIINDYETAYNVRASCNVIEVVGIAYNKSGAISIALRNTKSNYCVLFGVRHDSTQYPSISIIGKYLFDPKYGIDLE